MKLASAITRYSASKRAGGTIGSTQKPMAKRSCFHGGLLAAVKLWYAPGPPPLDGAPAREAKASSRSDPIMSPLRLASGCRRAPPPLLSEADGSEADRSRESVAGTNAAMSYEGGNLI